MFSNMDAVQIHHGHLDRINDVCFDWSGKRMATCSNDHHVKIWQETETLETSPNRSTTEDTNKLPAKFATIDQDVKNAWKNTHRFRAHDGAVWKVAWADPHFGQVSSLVVIHILKKCAIYVKASIVEYSHEQFLHTCEVSNKQDFGSSAYCRRTKVGALS